MSDGSCSVTDTEAQTTFGRLNDYEASAPLLHATFMGVADMAPEILNRQDALNAFLAVALVDWRAFGDPEQDPPWQMTEDEVLKAWSRSFHYWSRRRSDAWTISVGGDRKYLWPYLETGLRALAPGLPRKLRLPQDLKRIDAFGDRRLEAYLRGVASLFQIVALNS